MTIQKITPLNYRKSLATGKINFEADTFKIGLMTDEFIFDRALHSFWSDVSTYEILQQNGYTGVITLPSPLVTNTVNYTADFGSVLLSATGGSLVFKTVVMFDNSAVNSPLIAAIILPQNRVITAGNTYLLSNIIINIGD